MNKKSDENEFKKLEDLLINTEIDMGKSEELIFNRLKYRIETGTIKLNHREKDDIKMKNKLFKPARAVTLTAALLIGGVSITYGSEIISSIIARFQVGHTEITQYDKNNGSDLIDNTVDEISLESMQEGFKGKLFDKNGKDALYGEHQDYYTAEGQLITGMGVKDLPNGKHDFIVYTDGDDSANEKILTVDEVKKVANSNIKLPEYMPQGYTFKEATTSFEGQGVNAVYENQTGDSIVILASGTKEATSGVATTDEVTETSIGGNKVTLSTNCAFWESKGITYQLYWNFNHTNESELLSMDMKEASKIIESMN